ncbi:MAG TPA: hypothetical protein DDZ90_33300 [Planctomycetaceae bacterium]|nr:hypothetical protein [Gimesia sp.]HBL48269.1 hypothetical protein [Planctomycetaceae bacterium]
MDQWTRVMRLSRLLIKAQQRHCPVAFQRCLEQYKHSVSRMIHDLTTCHSELTTIKRPTVIPSLRELVDELCSLPDEFDETRIDWSEQEIVVRTPPVILREVNLGEFEIRLRWSELGDPQPYQVISLSQTGTDDVHHPHVQGETLCEGEGKLPITQALTECRLGDFFLLVQQVLQTYNPGSAYVPLDRWWNTTCADCGDSVDHDESGPCSNCEHRICEYCRRSCTACGDHLCASCADTCAECDGTFCRSCLSDETCSHCLEESMENEYALSESTSPDAPPAAATPSETSEAAQTPPAPVQPVCLGQTDLPA